MEGTNGNDNGSNEAKAGVEVTETTQVRPLRKRAQEKYPDFNPEDEKEWEAKEDEVFGELEESNKGYKDAEAKLDELISTDEELANVLNDMIVNKVPLRVAIAKYYSQEDLLPVEGEEDFEAYQNAYNERVSKKEAKDARDKEIADNEAKSLDAIDAFASEKGMDDEAKKGFVEFINNTFNDMLYKKLSPETLGAFYNAMNHDADVKSAEEAGEIKGRNANIEAQMEEEEKNEAGDGIPAVGKGGSSEQPEEQESSTMLDSIINRKRNF